MPTSPQRLSKLALIVTLLLSTAAPAIWADEQATSSKDTAPEAWGFHSQVTNVTQWHNDFNAPYTGANSMEPHTRKEETTDITFYVGGRITPNTELWINPEIDQGFGVSNTLGAGGYPSGEAYKVGDNVPYIRVPRLFVRHIIPLSGESDTLESAANQLAGKQAKNNVTLTIGKFSVVDLFDTNRYAHDPRTDFLNWALLEAGAFDYAADPWGFTHGAAVEWNKDSWTLRGGIFQMSPQPNSKVAGIHFKDHQLISEAEKRYHWNSHPGKVKLLAFASHAKMASYQEAVSLGQQLNTAPDTEPVRKKQWRTGVAINLEQELTDSVGAFARLSANDGKKEAYEFTEINRSLAAGLSIKGSAWKRPNDTVGLGMALNQLSGAAQSYFSAGGMGILIGDGQLNYAAERVFEAYYSIKLHEHISLTLDYQKMQNPAYNSDRGPINFFAVRTHIEF
jgi:high affinity Mn2+ porin